MCKQSSYLPVVFLIFSAAYYLTVTFLLDLGVIMPDVGV